MDFKEFENKKIFVRLLSKKIYSGDVLEIVFMGTNEKEVPIYLFTINDKFGNRVCFSSSEIAELREQE